MQVTTISSNLIVFSIEIAIVQRKKNAKSNISFYACVNLELLIIPTLSKQMHKRTKRPLDGHQLVFSTYIDKSTLFDITTLFSRNVRDSTETFMIDSPLVVSVSAN